MNEMHCKSNTKQSIMDEWTRIIYQWGPITPNPLCKHRGQTTIMLPGPFFFFIPSCSSAAVLVPRVAGNGPSNRSKSESSPSLVRSAVAIFRKTSSGSNCSDGCCDFKLLVLFLLLEVLTSRRGMERCGPREEAAGTVEVTSIIIGLGGNRGHSHLSFPIQWTVFCGRRRKME